MYERHLKIKHRFENRNEETKTNKHQLTNRVPDYFN